MRLCARTLLNKYYLCGDFVISTLHISIMTETITHEAVVKAVDGEHVRVTIVQSSACSGCAARKMCNSAEAKEKDVEVCTQDAAAYRVGDQVVLEGLLSDGRRAAMIAYGLPLVLLLVALVIAIKLTGSDTQGALWALGTVLLYYLIVFLGFRKRLQQSFSFRIKH